MNNFPAKRAAAFSLAGLILVTTAGCSAEASSSAGTTLTVLDYGGPYQKAQETEYFEPCSKELGVTIKTDEPTDFSKIRTAVDSGNVPWDLVNVTNDFGSEANGAAYLEPIDYNIVDKSKLVDGYGEKYRVGSDIEALVMAYNTSKGAVVNFTRVLAAEWGEHGITVNAIAPGFFPSKMTRHTLQTIGADTLASHAPLRRLGDDDDLKGAAVLFASAAGKHITGQILVIDGGVSCVTGG